MSDVSFELTAAQAEDIANLAHAAGMADSPATLGEIIIRVTEDHVEFGVTDAMVAVARRGTHGEFGGTVLGEGTFSLPARKLAQLLRLKVKEMKKVKGVLTFKMAFVEGGLRFDGIWVADVKRPIRNDRVHDLVNPMYGEGPFEHEYNGVLPVLRGSVLKNLGAASGGIPLRIKWVGQRRWGAASVGRDSWQFAAVFMETNG